MRSMDTVAVTSGGSVLLVGADGSVLTTRTADVAAWSHLLQCLAGPVAGAALHDAARGLPELDETLWDRLVSGGFVLASADREVLAAARDRVFSDNRGFHFARGAPTCGHLVFACTGSIVAGLMAPTVLSLFGAGFQNKLDVILTQAAQKFVTRDLFECYGVRTWGDAFERQDGIRVPHVELGRSADCILVMPASANALHRLAHGACTDLLSMTVAATKAPVVLAPVMNETMWDNPAVQRNVQVLREDGMYVIEPTIIFGAADFSKGGDPMYGGHGTLWAGPGALMRVISAILRARGSSGAA
jgi:phosphopantothenoylcysteine decarboxylase/phosphopantothenate--cysteine ligase